MFVPEHAPLVHGSAVFGVWFWICSAACDCVLLQVGALIAQDAVPGVLAWTTLPVAGKKVCEPLVFAYSVHFWECGLLYSSEVVGSWLDGSARGAQVAHLLRMFMFRISTTIPPPSTTSINKYA